MQIDDEQVGQDYEGHHPHESLVGLDLVLKRTDRLQRIPRRQVEGSRCLGCVEGFFDGSHRLQISGHDRGSEGHMRHESGIFAVDDTRSPGRLHLGQQLERHDFARVGDDGQTGELVDPLTQVALIAHTNRDTARVLRRSVVRFMPPRAVSMI